MSQRPRVTVWVGDDGGAVTAVQQAFAASADPNRQPRVVLAQAVEMTLSLTIVFDSRHDGPTVQTAVNTALADPDAGLLGVNVVGIGQVFYDSQVYAACLAVPGVVAVHSLDFTVTRPLRPDLHAIPGVRAHPADRVGSRSNRRHRSSPRHPRPAAASGTTPARIATCSSRDGNLTIGLEAAP